MKIFTILAGYHHEVSSIKGVFKSYEEAYSAILEHEKENFNYYTLNETERADIFVNGDAFYEIQEWGLK